MSTSIGAAVVISIVIAGCSGGAPRAATTLPPEPQSLSTTAPEFEVHADPGILDEGGEPPVATTGTTNTTSPPAATTKPPEVTADPPSGVWLRSPYVGLDLPGWKFAGAYDAGAAVLCAEGANHLFPVTEWVRPEQPEQPELWTRVAAGMPCETGLPLTAAELGPPGDSDVIVDFAPTTVLGRDARVYGFPGSPVFAIRWLISEDASGQILLAGQDASVEDAYEVASGVVALSEGEWLELRASPRAGYRPATAGVPLVIGLDHPDAQFAGGVAIRTAHGAGYELEWVVNGHRVEIWNVSGVSWPWSLAFWGDAEPMLIRELPGFYIPEPGNERYLWYENGDVINVRMRPSDGQHNEILESLVSLTDDRIIELTGGWIEAPSE